MKETRALKKLCDQAILKAKQIYVHLFWFVIWVPILYSLLILIIIYLERKFVGGVCVWIIYNLYKSLVVKRTLMFDV
jgi:hypothetical protein